MKKYLILFVSVCACACSSNNFVRNICSSTNNYWDIFYERKYYHDTANYGYNIKKNGDAFFYSYGKDNNITTRKIIKREDDYIFDNKWKLISDTILQLQNQNFKIINYNINSMTLKNIVTFDTVILRRSLE